MRRYAIYKDFVYEKYSKGQRRYNVYTPGTIVNSLTHNSRIYLSIILQQNKNITSEEVTILYPEILNI